jgi:methionyl-tRNA formyltransferase
MAQSLRLIFSGSGEFGLPTLRALLDAGHDIVQVVSQPDRPAGRGRTLTPTPIAAFAASQRLPLLKTANINTETLPPAGAMVVIAFGQKIGEAAVHRPRLGSVNLHASILPKYRGAAPINWAIINGEQVAGNSVIRLAPRMDAGAVLGQSSLEIGELETAGELHNRLAADGAPLVLRVLDELAAGTAVETPQDDSQATIAPKLSREASTLDFTRPAAQIARQIRGMYPWPGCRVRLIDLSGEELARLTLVRARAVVGDSGTMPGIINPIGFVSCGPGQLEVVELQPEGKKPMSLAAFRNGHRCDTNMHLESVG